jgi:catechol 2,3-dioxygenase-like lactoylglutathione lyase family enzyme
MKAHHIAIVIKDKEKLEAAKAFYGAFLGSNDIAEWEVFNTRCLIIKAEDFQVEFLYPLNKDSFVTNDPEGFRHIAFLPDDFDALLERIKGVDPGIVKQDSIPAKTDHMEGIVQFLERNEHTGYVLIELAKMKFM